MSAEKDAWKEWYYEQKLKLERRYEPSSFWDIFYDSAIGLWLLVLSWYWLPGLLTLKLYKWLSRD